MSGRLWTPLDQLRVPKWQIVLDSWKYRPSPDSHADVFDWEQQQLKTRILEGEDQRRIQGRLDRLLDHLLALHMAGLTTDEIAVAFAVTRQCIEKRLRKMTTLNRGRRVASRSSEIQVIQV